MTSIVCITGDVHHNIHKDVEVDEVETAKEYVNIIKNHNAKATLFITGRCIDENRAFWQDISKREYIELGAHTYYAFTFLNKVFDKVLKSPYGPYLYQYFDCWKTVNAFKKIGVKPICWRTHSYAGNKNTKKILPKFGFRVISDRVTPGVFDIQYPIKLVDVPVNVLNDDKIMTEFRSKRSMNNERKKILKSIETTGNIYNITVTQLHPICMKVLDNFSTFKQILSFFHSKNFMFMTMQELI